MKLETSQTFGNATYLLTDKEIAAILTEIAVSPSPASPLSGIDLSVVARTPPEDLGDLRDAMSALCAPDYSVDVRTWPDGGGWIRFYGPSASDRMVAYSRNDAGANLIVWPVTPGMLKSMVTAPLATAPAGPVEMPDFRLTFAELLGLASLVDRQQEILLRAFADRSGDPEIRFDTADIEACYAKGLAQSDDPRWMVPRLAHGLSLPLPEHLPDTRAMLAKFVDMRILLEDTVGLLPMPSVGLVFRQLADVDGVSALTVRDHAGGTVARRIYQANRAQIWGYRFGDAGKDDPPEDVILRVLSGSALSDDLAAVLPGAPATTAQEPAAPEPAAPEPSLPCPSCGADNLAGQKFCSACGASLTAAPAPEPAATVCANCGADLIPGNKFCTQCGQPVAQS